MTDNFAKVKDVMQDLLKALDALKADRVHPKQHEVSYGQKYAKITHDGSVYAFIDADGNIYKPAGWKAPAKHIRGSIFDANFSIGKAFGQYGVAYLR
jgi:hypothetical protein